MSIHDLDVRVNRDDRNTRQYRAARSACAFLRRQAEMRKPADKEELAQLIWKLYWRMYKAEMLAAPRTTRRMLREQFGFWTSAGVKSRPIAA